ncbi:LysR family transcriptional regulator [Tetragenococcus halophilus]|uniref:LysR family transcriptional regulator n=1 Tax=Tetragenococcus halophilus TaxID=51669 RepID=UPI00255D91DE|nr:LysR family transcriptional regulator [Tetragenococcus halophilus]GMG69669.1 LysR substrate-binding domain-containing protein [Tetragenococcus halophilus]
MKIQDLVYFKHLVESSSFTKTAEAFYVSQPSISLSLKRLENEFNTKLITRDRSKRSFHLEAAGEILYKNSGKVIDLLTATKKEMANIETNTVQLGFLPTIGGAYLSDLLPSMNQFIANLQLVEEESSKIMMDLLHENKLSIAISGSDSPNVEETWLEQYLIDERPLQVCVAPNHPLAKESLVTAEMLSDYSFISLDEEYTHYAIFDHWAKNNQINSKQISYTKEIQTAGSFIASGISVGIMVDLLVKNRTDIISLPLENAPKFYINLIINKNAAINPLQKEFNQKLPDIAMQQSEEAF